MKRRNQGTQGLYSRRTVLRSVGAAAITSLAACRQTGTNGDTGPPTGSSPHQLFDGYTDRQSYRPGDEVSLFLNGTANSGTAVLSLNQWGGNPVLPVDTYLYPQEPAGAAPWETGFGYRTSAALTLPPDLHSGAYLVDGLVPVIVKADPMAPPADIVIVYPSNTLAAYNAAGGRSMYTPVRAPIVSFLRPLGWISNVAFFSPFLEWFANPPLPYSFRYVADVDLEDYQEIAGSKLLVLIGHSEYWSRVARENFDQFVMEGGRALVLSGNTMWWQIRYGAYNSQLICYKESPDPEPDPALRTVNWTNRKLAYPIIRSIGADFPHGGFGVDYPKAGTGFRVLTPASPVFRGLEQKIAAGDLIEMPTLEYDGAPLISNPANPGEPQLDLAALDAYRAEIIGYENCARNDTESSMVGPATNIATWIAYQRTATSGAIINGASTNWCSRTGAFGVDGFRIRQIILNMMNILVRGESPFSS